MTDRAPVGPLDGIVVIELSLDVLHEVENVIACLRAGAVAWNASPFSGAVDQALRPKHVQHILDVAQEIEDEARLVHAARRAAYKEAAKPTRRKKR